MHFTIENTASLHEVIGYLKTQGFPVEVFVRKCHADVSSIQRARYFSWLDIVSEDSGYEPEELHDEFKILYLSSIFYIEFPEYKDACDNGDFAASGDMLSLKNASKDQMSRYMKRVYRHCVGDGIILPGGAI